MNGTHRSRLRSRCGVDTASPATLSAVAIERLQDAEAERFDNLSGPVEKSSKPGSGTPLRRACAQKTVNSREY